MNKKDDIEEFDETLIASSSGGSKDVHDRDYAQHFNSSQVERSIAYACQSGDDDRQTGRALSPETVALMCDERDAIDARDDSPTGVSSLKTSSGIKSSCTDIFNQADAEQERLVLTEFCGFLSKLIACSTIKGEIILLLFKLRI